jgi:microcin C transport system permease protein
MLEYIIKRILLIIPTLFIIILLNFIIVQFAPGGPVENTIAQLRGLQGGTEAGGIGARVKISDSYKASQGMDDELVAYIKKLYGFDKPAHERFFDMIKNYATFEFGKSFYQNKRVIDLVYERLPISISLGLWSTLIIYAISIPLGIAKAVRNGERFDSITSFIIAFLYAIPSFLLAIILIMLFAGDGAFSYFPIRGLVSSNFEELSLLDKIKDYAWHIALPCITLTLSGFASLTILTKNSFLEEINKQYVLTAGSKGLSDTSVLYMHVFRNAMLLIITSIPEILLKILFTGTVLIEIIFSLNGLGLLSYESAISRDYPVVFGTLYIFTLIGLIATLITDILYVVVDPRIDFEKRAN